MDQHEHAHVGELIDLKDAGLSLGNELQDIRGRMVVDQNGEALGHVHTLFVDKTERKVRLLEIRTGGFLGVGDRHVLLPVDTVIRVENDRVRVNETRERLLNAPAYDPDLSEPVPRPSWQPTDPDGW